MSKKGIYKITEIVYHNSFIAMMIDYPI